MSGAEMAMLGAMVGFSFCGATKWNVLLLFERGGELRTGQVEDPRVLLPTNVWFSGCWCYQPLGDKGMRSSSRCGACRSWEDGGGSASSA